MIAVSTIASVALCAMYLISRVFSSNKRSIQQLSELMKEGMINEITCADKLQVFAILSFGIGILELNIVDHGFQLQVPFVGNLLCIGVYKALRYD